jgi:uncharacterized protein with HEPN domain
MSSRDWAFRVKDILNSIEKIETYVDGLSLAQFRKNELVLDAVIRNLEIIGEASKNMPFLIRKKYRDIPWDHMRRFRNILIHEYFGVDVKIVWNTIQNDLPTIKEKLKTISLNDSEG